MYEITKINPPPEQDNRGWEFDPDWGFVTHDPDHIVVEGGHFYTVNGPSNASLEGWHIALQHASLWYREAGKTVLTALFVDDYHDIQPTFQPDFSGYEEVFLTGEKAESAVRKMVVQADLVFSEQDLAAGAFDAMLPLVDQNLVSTKKGVVSARGIRLGSGFDPNNPDSFQPTCVFLDYLLLCKKAEYGVDQYVVLPEWFEKQQQQLAAVIGKLLVPKLNKYACIYFAPYVDDPSSYAPPFEEVYHG